MAWSTEYWNIDVRLAIFEVEPIDIMTDLDILVKLKKKCKDSVGR